MAFGYSWRVQNRNVKELRFYKSARGSIALRAYVPRSETDREVFFCRIFERGVPERQPIRILIWAAPPKFTRLCAVDISKQDHGIHILVLLTTSDVGKFARRTERLQNRRTRNRNCTQSRHCPQQKGWLRRNELFARIHRSAKGCVVDAYRIRVRFCT